MLTVMKPLRLEDLVKKPKEPKPKKGIKRGPGKRLKAKKAKTGAALTMYFEKHGWDSWNGRAAWCQICGDNLESGAGKCHPCHKERSWKGCHEPENIVAGHPECHRWADAGSRSERETTLRLSPANCRDGGIIEWPHHLWISLCKAIKKEGLQQRKV